MAIEARDFIDNNSWKSNLLEGDVSFEMLEFIKSDIKLIIEMELTDHDGLELLVDYSKLSQHFRC